MEIPRHWQMIRLLGYKLRAVQCEDKHFNFPPNRPICKECGKPTKKHPLSNSQLESDLSLSPNDQVVHGEVVRKD